MVLKRQHLLLPVLLVAILCAPLYGHYVPTGLVPFAFWWEAGCIVFAAYVSRMIAAARP